MKLKDLHGSLDRDLQDPEYAALYLNDALHEGSPEELFLALRNIIRVTQGMSHIVARSRMFLLSSNYSLDFDLED